MDISRCLQVLQTRIEADDFHTRLWPDAPNYEAEMAEMDAREEIADILRAEGILEQWEGLEKFGDLSKMRLRE